MPADLEKRFYLAWLVSLGAALVGLYLSEVRGLPPSALTWYARVLMFPLVPLLGVALFRRDAGFRRSALALAALGSAVSLYHVLVYGHVAPALRSCGPIRCDAQSLGLNGVATGTDALLAHPLLNLLAFLLIAGLLLRGAGGGLRAARGPRRSPRGWP